MVLLMPSTFSFVLSIANILEMFSIATWLFLPKILQPSVLCLVSIAVVCLTLSFDAEEVFCNLECIETTWTGGSSGSSGFLSVYCCRLAQVTGLSDMSGHFSALCIASPRWSLCKIVPLTWSSFTDTFVRENVNVVLFTEKRGKEFDPM